jgi:hypothetical protein
MSKAYERVEWAYLRAILLKLGFHKKWVELLMSCVSTATFSVMVNGAPHGYIKPSRGLRQGDPLSPYLFLICVESLSVLIRKAESDVLICGVSICREGPRISHLFFANDSIIFCRATMSECAVLQQLLALYERASGQQINGAKTALFFSKNTVQDTREAIIAMFGTSQSTQFEKYLGLPLMLGRSKKRSFNDIKDHIWKRLQGWKEKLLSQAGCEVLIKAVIQAIPMYAISCFKHSAGLCAEICSMANRFGGANMEVRGVFTGLTKKSLVGIRWKVAWGSVTYSCSIKHLLHARVGDSFNTQTLWCFGYLKLSIFLTSLF